MIKPWDASEQVLWILLSYYFLPSSTVIQKNNLPPQLFPLRLGSSLPLSYPLIFFHNKPRYYSPISPNPTYHDFYVPKIYLVVTLLPYRPEPKIIFPVLSPIFLLHLSDFSPAFFSPIFHQTTFRNLPFRPFAYLPFLPSARYCYQIQYPMPAAGISSDLLPKAPRMYVVVIFSGGGSQP